MSSPLKIAAMNLTPTSAGVTRQAPGAGEGASAPNPAADTSRVREAAKQFEGIFVRQLLEAAKIMGPKGSQGHGAMAVESLADGVVRAGGLGLARQIEVALSGTALASPTTEKSSSPDKTHRSQS